MRVNIYFYFYVIGCLYILLFLHGKIEPKWGCLLYKFSRPLMCLFALCNFSSVLIFGAYVFNSSLGNFVAFWRVAKVSEWMDERIFLILSHKFQCKKVDFSWLRQAKKKHVFEMQVFVSRWSSSVICKFFFDENLLCVRFHFFFRYLVTALKHLEVLRKWGWTYIFTFMSLVVFTICYFCMVKLS